VFSKKVKFSRWRQWRWEICLATLPQPKSLGAHYQGLLHGGTQAREGIRTQKMMRVATDDDGSRSWGTNICSSSSLIGNATRFLLRPQTPSRRAERPLGLLVHVLGGPDAHVFAEHPEFLSGSSTSGFHARKRTLTRRR